SVVSLASLWLLTSSSPTITPRIGRRSAAQAPQRGSSWSATALDLFSALGGDELVACLIVACDRPAKHVAPIEHHDASTGRLFAPGDRWRLDQRAHSDRHGIPNRARKQNAARMSSRHGAVSVWRPTTNHKAGGGLHAAPTPSIAFPMSKCACCRG